MFEFVILRFLLTNSQLDQKSGPVLKAIPRELMCAHQISHKRPHSSTEIIVVYAEYTVEIIAFKVVL